MRVDWKEHIVSTADVLRGKPRVKGTRIPVSLVLRTRYSKIPTRIRTRSSTSSGKV